MEGFTFYKSYYETMKKMRKRQDQANIALAIVEYMFEGVEPKGLTEVGEIAFESFRLFLDKSRNNGGRGGRPKTNRVETETETELKPIENRIETDCETSSSYSYITPPFIPPQGGKTNDFFAKYPKYAKYKGDTSKVDFDRLLEEFDKSSYLRSLYTFKQVMDIYESILAGEYRDKPTEADAINARAERDSFYARRRRIAEDSADKAKARAMKNRLFAENEKALIAIRVPLAKAEIEEDADKISTLIAAQENMTATRTRLLAEMGLTEEDLLPKYHCEKCKDTGFMADGMACDCYGG